MRKPLARRHSFAITALLLFASIVAASSPRVLMADVPAAKSIFVATTGDDDANDGSRGKPFATLARARDRLREIPRDQPRAVIISGGTYVQPATLELGADDSGIETSPVTWRSADGEEVRIAGGPVLPPTAFAAVDDESVLSRLNPSARGKVVRTDLADLVAAPLPEYPVTFRGAPAMPELFFNDQRMTVARWPNDGWTTIEKIVDAGSIPREGDTAGRPGIFTYRDEQPSRWNADAGVWLQGYWCYDWYDESIKVNSIDRAARQITLAAPALYGVKQGNPSPRRFRAINVLEELDEPGEFYIDRAARRLYFWPPADIAAARVALSILNAPLLRAKDASHIVIRGIIFEASLGDGIEISGGRHMRVENCTVRNTRQLGIRVVGGERHRVTSCDITDTGAGGLLMEGGDRKTLTPARHEAIDNHIYNFSRHQLTAAYGISLGGVGNRAAHNLVHDAPHQAIFIGGNDHIFELNIVRNVVTETDDAGAVYKGRNPSCRGNVIRHNFFRDIGSPMGLGTGAIYFDDGDGGDSVFGNIFLRCGDPGAGSFGTVFSHGGHGSHADNNIFIDCKRALGSAPWDDARWKDAIDGGQDCHFQTKLLEEVNITRPPYTRRYPELIGFMDPRPGAPRDNHAKNNVFVRCGQPAGGNWKLAESQTWSTDADPGFVDLAAGDLRLRPDAEVFKRLPAFQPIPFDRIGPLRKRD